MALYTVVDKNTGDQVTATEYNQLKDALADGTITINAEGYQVAGVALQSSDLSDGAALLKNLSEDTTPSLGGTLDATDNNIQNIKLAEFQDEHDNGNSGAADTIVWGEGNNQKSTLTGNVTYTFTAPSGPSRLQLRIIQDATGSRTVTWPASVKWPGGTAPTLSTAASSVDIVTMFYDGTNYYGVFTGGMA